VKVYEGVARAFAAEGVTDVFGMMGDGNMHWMDAVAGLGINIFDVRHEGAGLAMADGWGRVARDRRIDVPGVCTTTMGPGVAQLATTMITASRARTPLVAFVGEGPDGDEEFPQHLDQQRFAATLESGFIRITSPETAEDAVQKAFYLAKYESRPIMLSARVKTQLMEFESFDDYVPSSALLDQVPPFPHPAAIDAAAAIIGKSSRPVIIVGRGAIWSGAGPAILELAENIGALVATTLMAKTWLNDYEFHAGISGLYSTRAAMELFAESDCVIGFGASLNKFTTEHGYLYPKAKYVHIDAKPHTTMFGGRGAECYVHSDARLGAEALTESLRAGGLGGSGYRTPEVKECLESALDDPAEYQLDDGTLDPRTVCRALDQVLPPEIGLVLGGGHQAMFGTILFTVGRSLVLAQHHFGCIGQGLTTAMGAVIAAGNQPTLLVEGDASLMMHLAEFETAVRYNLPLLVVVINDRALGSEYHKMAIDGLNAHLAKIETPDLGAVAIALGGRGRCVTSIDDLRSGAEEFVARPGPMVLDVRVSRNVVSIPFRRLHLGIDA
jgi:acetolactate synthase-1/2/3 large subunit